MRPLPSPLKPWMLCIGFLAAVVSAGAQSLAATEASAEEDLRATLAEIAALQETIRDEKIPLSRQLRELEAHVGEQRRELERIQRLESAGSLNLEQLRQQVTAREENISYLKNLVSEYLSAIQVRLDGAELMRIQDTLQGFNTVRDNPSLSDLEQLQGMLGVVAVGLERAQAAVSGLRIPGEAATPEGPVVQGTFLLYGPTTYFSDGTLSGLAESPAGGTPVLVPLPDDATAGLAETIQTGSGPLPLDPTLGDALAIAETEETLWEHIQKGGIWIWPILTAALIATVIALIKAWQVYTFKVPAFGTLHTVLAHVREGDKEAALAAANAIPGTTGRMIADGVHHADEEKELIEEVMYERIIESQPKLESWLPAIAVIAATAPLMGLLGTVTGMINTFKLITIFGTGDAKSLSSGISEALVTTEFGLIVAIPALVAHAIISRRVQSILAQMERFALAYVNGLSRAESAQH